MDANKLEVIKIKIVISVNSRILAVKKTGANPPMDADKREGIKIILA